MFVPRFITYICVLSAAPVLPSADIDAYAAKVRANRVACAPISAWYCLRRLGHHVDRQEVLDGAMLGEDGIGAHDLLSLCERFGLHPRAVAGSPDRLAELPIPSILIIDDQHCVVYDGMVGSDAANVFEPITQRSGVEKTEWLLDHWTGEAIIFGDVRPSTFRVLVVAALSACATIIAGWLVLRCQITRGTIWGRAPDV